mgnify:CR=1 FL=1
MGNAACTDLHLEFQIPPQVYGNCRKVSLKLDHAMLNLNNYHYSFPCKLTYLSIRRQRCIMWNNNRRHEDISLFVQVLKIIFYE